MSIRKLLNCIVGIKQGQSGLLRFSHDDGVSVLFLLHVHCCIYCVVIPYERRHVFNLGFRFEIVANVETAFRRRPEWKVPPWPSDAFLRLRLRRETPDDVSILENDSCLLHKEPSKKVAPFSFHTHTHPYIYIHSYFCIPTHARIILFSARRRKLSKHTDPFNNVGLSLIHF